MKKIIKELVLSLRPRPSKYTAYYYKKKKTKLCDESKTTHREFEEKKTLFLRSQITVHLCLDIIFYP